MEKRKMDRIDVERKKLTLLLYDQELEAEEWESAAKRQKMDDEQAAEERN